ncbi:MAG TPA: ABC transporter permease [Clostridia bacterium]|nr:ABC transporter permease [Clostridia bacterium]
MRAFTVAGRVIRQILKDKRTLALLFVAPVLVVFLLYTVLTSETGKPRVLTVGLPEGLQAVLAESADAAEISNLSDAMEELKARRTDAVITYEEPTVTVTVEGSETAGMASVQKAVATAVSQYAKAHAEETIQAQMEAQKEKIRQQLQDQFGALFKIAGQNLGDAIVSGIDFPESPLGLSLMDLRYESLNGSDPGSAFDNIAPLMMGFFIFFFVFLLAGVAFLRERTSGTLERLLATPVRRYEIVLGYFLGFGVFVFLQTLVIQIYMVNALHIALKGDFALVMLVNLLLAAGSLALGTLLSAFARNELQLFQFIPLVIVPQVLFCGLFSPRGAPAWVVVLSKVFPLTYAADALTSVALRGAGFRAILPDLILLFGYMILFLMLNTLVLKKTRRI